MLSPSLEQRRKSCSRHKYRVSSIAVSVQSAPNVLGSVHEGSEVDDVSDGAGAAGLGVEAESGVGSMVKKPCKEGSSG